jgi:hypothetical protein
MMTTRQAKIAIDIAEMALKNCKTHYAQWWKGYIEGMQYVAEEALE